MLCAATSESPAQLSLLLCSYAPALPLRLLCPLNDSKKWFAVLYKDTRAGSGERSRWRLVDSRGRSILSGGSLEGLVRSVLEVLEK